MIFYEIQEIKLVFISLTDFETYICNILLHELNLRWTRFTFLWAEFIKILPNEDS